MDYFVVFEAEVFRVFALVMVRVSGLIVSAPVLGSRNFPMAAKAGLAGLTAMLITPHIWQLEQTLPNDALSFALMGAGELLIGLMMGFVMTMVFAAIQVAGQLMDMQSGFAMMNVFNPAMGTQFPIFGFFIFILAVLVLLVTNGHHVMIRAVVSTFDSIPLGGFTVRPALLWEAGQWGRAMFVDGLMIAAPVAGALLLVYVVMGLFGRVAPQVQMFAVGFPLTIATALLVTALSIHVYIALLEGMFSRMFENVSTVIRGMG